MKHLRQYKHNKDISRLYLIPSYPIEAYRLALTKIGMNKEDIKRWHTNKHASYWDNKHVSHIIMSHDYYHDINEYEWAWLDKDTIFSQDYTVIELDPHELDSIKYNL